MQNKFSEYIAIWFCDNINHVDEQTLTLLEYLGAQEPDKILSKEECEALAIKTVLVSQLVSIEKN
jgi:hypothetical protein